MLMQISYEEYYCSTHLLFALMQIMVQKSGMKQTSVATALNLDQGISVVSFSSIYIFGYEGY